MAKKILIIDTNIMCAWLNVPGKEIAKGKDCEWTHEQVVEYIDAQVKDGVKLCLPMTSVIETGNHIAHIAGNRESSADALTNVIMKSANGETPWMEFDNQNYLWQKDRLSLLAQNWYELVIKEEHAFGDAIIVEIAKYYASQFDIEIFTTDGLLKGIEGKIMGQKQKNNLRRNRGK